jgi:hypothetical protein
MPGFAPATPLGFAGYANPLKGARVKAERIDMGVDYAGTGVYEALGRGVVTQSRSSGSGWPGPGGYVEYRITEGPLNGKYVYMAEGVSPLKKVGDIVNRGDPVARFTADQSSGTEIGFGAGRGTSTYASVYGGGYSEGQATGAGAQFSELIQSLGGPPGLLEGRPITGTGPLTGSNDPITGAIGSAAGTVGNVIGGGISLTEAVTGFISNPVPALLTVAFVVIGIVMIFSGAGKLLGFQTPLRSAAGAATKGAKVAAI